MRNVLAKLIPTSRSLEPAFSIMTLHLIRILPSIVTSIQLRHRMTLWTNLKGSAMTANRSLHMAIVLVTCAMLLSTGRASSGGELDPVSCAPGRLKADSGDYQGALSDWKVLASEDTPKEQLRAVLSCLSESGMAIDHSNAASWIFEAAQNKAVDAQLYLGMLYASGVGVSKDLQQAKQWLTLATEHGSESAAFLLEILEKSGSDEAWGRVRY